MIVNIKDHIIKVNNIDYINPIESYSYGNYFEIIFATSPKLTIYVKGQNSYQELLKLRNDLIVLLSKKYDYIKI